MSGMVRNIRDALSSNMTAPRESDLRPLPIPIADSVTVTIHHGKQICISVQICQFGTAIFHVSFIELIELT